MLVLDCSRHEPDFAVELLLTWTCRSPLIEKEAGYSFYLMGFIIIVFSGWSNASYGTFSVVVAVENAVSPNGKFRVLVIEDDRKKKKKKKRWLTIKMGEAQQVLHRWKTYRYGTNVAEYLPMVFRPLQIITKGKIKNEKITAILLYFSRQNIWPEPVAQGQLNLQQFLQIVKTFIQLAKQSKIIVKIAAASPGAQRGCIWPGASAGW